MLSKIFNNADCDVIKALKQNGARFARNDKEANQILRIKDTKGAGVVLSLLAGDVILIHEDALRVNKDAKCVKCEGPGDCSHSCVDGPWLAIVTAVKKNDLIHVRPLDFLNSKIIRHYPEYIFHLDLKENDNDELIVINRNGLPICNYLEKLIT